MKQIIVVFFTLLSLNVFSQISIGYSGGLGLFNTSSILQTDDGGYIAVKKVETKSDPKSKNWNDFRQTITLLKYGKDFKLIKDVMLSGGSSKYSGHYSEFKKVGSKYWFIYLEPLDNYDVGSIKAVEIDPLTLEQKETKIVASSNSLNHSIPKLLKVDDLNFISRSSPSGKFVYLYVRLSDSDYFITCLDENFKTVWGRKETVDGLKSGGISSIEVDDAGVIYMGFVKKKDLHYSVYSSTGKMNTYEVKITAGTAKEILFSPTKINNIVFVLGTYSEGENCNGFYKGIINKKGELTSVSITVFPETIIDPLHKEGWASSKAKKFGVKPTFTAVPILLPNDGFGMLAEFFAITEANGAYYMHGGSLLYVNFSKELPSITRAPKYSLGRRIKKYGFNGSYDEGCLYYAYSYDSKMILFYFDNPANLSRDMALDAKVVNASNQVLVAAVIEADGSIKRQQLSPISSFGTTGITVTPGNILVPLVINKADVLVSVKL